MKKIVSLVLVILACVAWAQESAKLEVGQSETLGPYLTDGEGRSLYLFVNKEATSQDPERMTSGVRSNAAACEGQCLENWPPLAASEVEAGEGVEAELLYTAEVGGTMMVVYNGWPLYYFANDAAPGDTNGQGLGRAPNTWYLVSPSGMSNETAAQ